MKVLVLFVKVLVVFWVDFFLFLGFMICVLDLFIIFKNKV